MLMLRKYNKYFHSVKEKDNIFKAELSDHIPHLKGHLPT